MENTARDGHVRIRRNDVNMIGLDASAFLDFDHRHSGRPAKQLRQDAFVLWSKVLNENECHTRIAGQCRQ